MNGQNLYNSQHKTANCKSRAGFDSISWGNNKECWRCGGQGYILKKGTSGDYNMVCPECG